MCDAQHDAQHACTAPKVATDFAIEPKQNKGGIIEIEMVKWRSPS
jgi:hypothetical protein